MSEMVETARSLHQRGYSFGTAGNLSVRSSGTVFISPTNSSFGSLTPEGMAQIDLNGNVIGPNKPSKEAHFHLAVYRALPDAGAVVHLHSAYATALCCLDGLDMDDALPVFTPYYAMRLPRLPVVPYQPPGDPALAPVVEERIAGTRAVLLQNHGPITAGKNLMEASALAEELEEQSRLFFILAGRGRRLRADEIAELRRRFR